MQSALTTPIGMSQQQPQLYASLTAALGPEEQQVIKAALEHADKIAVEQQQQTTSSANGAQTGANGQPQTNGTV